MKNNFCSNCGEKLDSNFNFCSKCGENTNSQNNNTISRSLNDKNTHKVFNITSMLIMAIPMVFVTLVVIFPLLTIPSIDSEDDDSIIGFFAGSIFCGLLIWVYTYFFKNAFASKILSKYTYFIFSISSIICIFSIFTLIYHYTFPNSYIRELVDYYAYYLNTVDEDIILEDYRFILKIAFFKCLVFFIFILWIKLLFMKRWFKDVMNLNLFDGLKWYKKNFNIKTIFKIFITMN